jgi:hypothetical protein
MSVSGWQSIAASRLNASNADTWRGARQASKDIARLDVRCALAVSGPTKGRATQPQNVSDFNGSRRPFSRSSSRISAPRQVIEVECFDGHIWMPTVSSDGVAVMVSRLRQRALVTGQWMKTAA